MRNAPNLRIEPHRYAGPRDSNYGAAIFPKNGRQLRAIFSQAGGWDHVSVSLPDRPPTWSEMCFIKDLFFREDEVVMQLHPAKKDYINYHPYCLHLWRPQTEEEVRQEKLAFLREGATWHQDWPQSAPPPIPLPPAVMVGPPPPPAEEKKDEVAHAKRD